MSKELTDIEGLCGCTLIDCIPAKANIHRANATHAYVEARLERGLLLISGSRGLKQWRHLANVGKTLGSRYAEDPSVFQQSQEMFKTLLFEDKFDFKLCPIRLIEFEDDDWDIGDQNVPHCKSTKLMNSSGIIESHIGACKIEAQIDNYHNRLGIYLRKILHQMIHSYEDLHVCSCTDCTSKLKKFIRKEIGLHVCLGRSNAVAAKLRSSGTPRGASIDTKLENLGLDAEDIWDKIQNPDKAGHRYSIDDYEKDRRYDLKES